MFFGGLIGYDRDYHKMVDTQIYSLLGKNRINPCGMAEGFNPQGLDWCGKH